VSGTGELYEEGDVNAQVPEANDDYEPGDVNSIDDGAGPADTGYEAGDINAVAPSGADHGGTPEAVLTYLARALSNEPDAVVVDTEARSGSVRLRLHVASEDMGRVIGRRGRTAQALRSLVGVAGARDGVQTSVDIVDA
jgi:predicted RNA-binding protein YlqC (UPF0109 family)